MATRPGLPPGWFKALMVVGVVVTGVATVAATSVYLMFGAHYALMAVVLTGAATLVAMWFAGPTVVSRCLRRLAPVGVFALVALVVAAIISTRMPSGIAGFWRVSLAPACWFSSAVLGYFAGRFKAAPLAAAAGSVGTAALVGFIALSEVGGLTTPWGRLYVAWSTSVGAWSPGTGESFRAVGLDVDPNTFGLVGTVALVAAVCIGGPLWLRASVAAASGAVIVLSGSRTAVVAAVLAVGVVAIGAWLRRHVVTGDHTRPLVIAVAGAVLGAVVTVALIGAAGQGVSAVERLGTTATGLAGSGVGAESPAAIENATGGRTEIWARAWRLYLEHPLGVFVQPETLLGRSIHNEYLDRLVTGGPLSLLALLGLLGWLAIAIRPPAAPMIGPALCAVYAVAAVTLGPSLLPPFMGLAFYLVGWGCAQPQRPRPGAAVLEPT